LLYPRRLARVLGTGESSKEAMVSRRAALTLGAMLAPWGERTTLAAPAMSTRTIPKTGEKLPCVGLGTWQTFDVGPSASERAVVTDVLRAFFAASGTVIDSSPMYGRAEEVTGATVAALNATGKPFLATKVWTSGKERGIREMERSFERMRTRKMDLMQVHNLLEVGTHLPVLREWKAAGKIRYLGVTHYAHSAFGELERLMKTEALDFVQLPYSLSDREAEKRLLPVARDTGTAVLVMRPFQEGELFRRVRGKPLPDVAFEIDAASPAQLFLKFILAHPAVTCPIPATSNPKHAADNVKAGTGRLPDATQRAKLVRWLEG
jgi:aryl-alcohol dehydrogenase-like predicted oxidoreductase